MPGFLKLSVLLEGDTPPSSFRIFRAGKNDSTKGSVLFDDVAGRSVMAKWNDYGNELAIDYQHAMLEGLVLDPALSGKAAGWFGLELRAGELWAVNVRWTEPAAAALSRKEWRYVSPAFYVDDEERVTEVVNVALTNVPATKNQDALMAATRLALLGGNMDPAILKAALDALQSDDPDAIKQALKDMIAGEQAEDAAEGDAGAGAGAGAGASDGGMAMAAPGNGDQTAVAAAATRLTRITGKSTLSEAVDEVEVWRKSHLALEAERVRLRKERAQLEAGERRRLYGELVTRAGRKPASVWANPTAKAEELKAKPYLETMSIADLRQHVADEVGAAPLPGHVLPPVAGGGTADLSEREVAICKKYNVKPEDYMAQRDGIRRASETRPAS